VALSFRLGKLHAANMEPFRAVAAITLRVQGDCTSSHKCMLNWRPVVAKTESGGRVGSYYRDYIPSTKASCLAWTRIPVGNTRRRGEATLPWRPCRQIFSGCSSLKGFGWGREV
jgi:hypothetical protein